MRHALRLLLLLAPLAAFGSDTGVNPAARVRGKTTQVCVTNAAGGTYVPGNATTHSPLVGRRSLEVQNLGPNAIYCTVDGATPLATGALGRKVDATSGLWSVAVGERVVLRCIAAAAAQASPACAMVTELQ